MIVDDWNIIAGQSLAARAIGGLSDQVTSFIHCRSRADRNALIKAQFSVLNTAAKGRTSDEMEAIRQCAHDQQRRLEAMD